MTSPNYTDSCGNITSISCSESMTNEELKDLFIQLFKKIDVNVDFLSGSEFVTHFDDKDVHLKCTALGFANRNDPDEWRVQCNRETQIKFNEYVDLNQPSFLLGYYKTNGRISFQIWKYIKSPVKSNVSKYTRITSVAESYIQGVSKYVDNKGQIVYSVLPDNLFCTLYFLVNQTIRPQKSFINDKIYNRILFGAPGTGKSYKVKCDSEIIDGSIERVTFYPTYTYGQFVGTYKPIMRGDSIAYSFVPGPFLRTYVNSLKYKDKTHLLIIEEINRANAASVFGDVFQLLDRNLGKSVYPVVSSEDVRAYLQNSLYPDYDSLTDDEKELANNVCSTISLPDNMYIWATMNSSDQGIQPLDTAFKRRWNFEYIGIDDSEDLIPNTKFKINDGIEYSWNQVRVRINKILLWNCNVSEDKLLGPFFIKLSDNMDDSDFSELIKTKVIMYLYDDVAKHCRSKLFSDVGCKTYSEICTKFDEIGMGIFVDL